MKTNEKDTKQGVVPALRFPEFKTLAPWQTDTVDNLVSTITPPCKLNTSEYQKTGEYPIVDQSQDLYCGWTNNQSAVIFQHFPLIIFGDHTCVIKLINRPFAQGADGIKILKSRGLVDPHFLYQCLENKPITQESYKRHFALLRSKIIAYPPKKTREQQKIADCLSSIDALIKAAENKIDELKAHKKGLMQQLFPAEGKTVPALRFPEFQNAGEWTKISFGELTYKVSKKNKTGKRYPIYSINNKQGFIRQEEQFTGVDSNDRGYDLFLYNIVGSKTFAYNPARINVGSIGYSGDLKDVIISSLYVCFKTSETVNDEFLLKYFETESFKKAVLNSVEGGIRSYLFYDNFAKINLYLPPNYDTAEQQKIADCLSSVDNLIMAQTNRLEALRNHKKGLMQQLFPNIE